jgi:antiphage defense system Thoeris ThsB-like protein
MAATRLFVCFDSAQDDDLRLLFARQCGAPGSTLRVADWSRGESPHAGWEQKLRDRMEQIDAVVVLCGEATHSAMNVNREFGIVQEQDKPYVLLWGRRTGTCTRPSTALVADHFYSWSWSVLTEQLHHAIRLKLDPLGIERATLLGIRTRRP